MSDDESAGMGWSRFVGCASLLESAGNSWASRGGQLAVAKGWARAAQGLRSGLASTAAVPERTVDYHRLAAAVGASPWVLEGRWPSPPFH